MVMAARGDAASLSRRLGGGAHLDVRREDDTSWLSLGCPGNKTVAAVNQEESQDPKFWLTTAC